MGILDRFRKAQPLDPSVRGETQGGSKSPFKSVGAPGTAIYGGYLIEKEKDSDLKGQQKYITFSNNLTNVSIVGAGVRYFTNLVAKAEWSVEPADDSAAAEDMAEQVKEIMDDMTTPWHRVIRRAAMYVFYGFSVQEWTAKRNEDGTVGMLDIEPRPQVTIERWDVDTSGTVLGVVQRNPQTQEEIYLPRTKCVYLVDDTLNDSPEGLGLFRHIAKACKTLQRYELLEAWGFETDLRGVPIARGPFTLLEQMVTTGQLTQTQVASLKQPMLDFIESHNRNPELGMLLDSQTYTTTDERGTPSTVRQWDVDLLQGSPGTAAEVAAAIERLNREIARVLGVEQLLLGSDSKGSHALAKDKTQQFGLLVDATLKELKEVFERDFLDPLWTLNGWDPELKPSFKIEKIQYRDIEQITTALAELSRAALAPDDPATNEVRALLGLSDAPEPDEADLALFQQSLLPPVPPGSGEEEEMPEEEEEETEKSYLPLPERGVEDVMDFVDRFMRNPAAMVEFPDPERRRDVALNRWRNA